LAFTRKTKQLPGMSGPRPRGGPGPGLGQPGAPPAGDRVDRSALNPWSWRIVVALALHSTTLMERPRPWPPFMITEDLAPWGIASQIRNSRPGQCRAPSPSHRADHPAL